MSKEWKRKKCERSLYKKADKQLAAKKELCDYNDKKRLAITTTAIINITSIKAAITSNNHLQAGNRGNKIAHIESLIM